MNQDIPSIKAALAAIFQPRQAAKPQLVRVTFQLRDRPALWGTYTRAGAALRLWRARHLPHYLGHTTEAV